MYLSCRILIHPSSGKNKHIHLITRCPYPPILSHNPGQIGCLVWPIGVSVLLSPKRSVKWLNSGKIALTKSAYLCTLLVCGVSCEPVYLHPFCVVMMSLNGWLPSWCSQCVWRLMDFKYAYQAGGTLDHCTAQLRLCRWTIVNPRHIFN